MSIRAPRLALFILLFVAPTFSQFAPKVAPLPYDPLELATGPTVVPDTPEKRAVLLYLRTDERQNSAMHTPGMAPFSIKVSFNSTGGDSYSQGYGELAASNFSGVGISCGSGLCNICLAVLSVPVISFSVPKAGDFIDASAAQVTGDRANRLRISKEKGFQLNGFTGDRAHNALTVYYQEVIANLIGSLRAHIASAQKLPKLEQSVPLVLSGGTAMPKGFLDHFIRILEAEEFPLRLSEVRVSGDPLHSTARGALMAALC